MSLRNTFTLGIVKEFISLSLLLGVMPALTYGIAKWLLFADYFELGMYRTAFYYFRSTINDYSILLLFAVVLLLISGTYLFLTAVPKRSG